MNKASIVLVILLSGLLSEARAETYTPGQKVNKDFASFAEKFLIDNCMDCHGETEPEGNLSLHDLGPIDEVNSGTWTSIWAQVTLKEMPPKDSTQPKVVERLQFSDWIVGELTRVMKDKGGFRDHLDPNKGNFVDHDLLFGPLPDGIKLKPTSSPSRLWRVTPQEHITRLNELINKEQEFDPSKPGLRTQGDVVPTNHGGELKLYFGTDRIIKWQGGTVAYATSVKSIPAVLSSARHHGLENYPDLYSVNSAEATQIMNAAEDIIRYMADGPLSIANAYQITDSPKSIADKLEGDLRGLPTSLVYSTEVKRPLTPVYEFMKEEGVTDNSLRAAVNFLFEALTYRPPSKKESDEYIAIVKESIEKLGKKDGAVLGLTSIFLDRDSLFRPELAKKGEPDQHGRVMLQGWELGLAVNQALRYIKPDEKLRKAIVEGDMRTKDDVKREVERMLADDSIRKPRILQFFRDYFDYDLGGYICKDTKALAETGVSTRGSAHYRAMFDATASTDRLVELILHEDKDVLRNLLTTDKVVATRIDNVYFGRRRTKEEVKVAVAAAKLVEAEIEKKEAAELEAWLEANPGKEPPKSFAKKKQKRIRARKNHKVTEVKLSGSRLYARVSRRSFGNGSMKPERILATVPEGQRLGILTHPSWLVSHSDAMDNHAILRGRWIRERLLGGGIPDVPITVDAMLPDEPHNTLRERMRVTKETYCWTCHNKMDPLGLPFEMFNHSGLFREVELDKPVDTAGEIINSGDPSIDGKVINAIEMIRKLAESKRVEQVFVRHAFRFWMGRNETLNDAPVLQDAYLAYKDNGGSMNALISSLLTSDAFLYRTRSESTSEPTKVSHWSDHRGPQRNYHLNTKTDYPKKWSVASNENIRWKMPLPETGHSGIAVWGDKLFLTCFRKLTEKDYSKKGTWVSETRGYCLAADTGKILWSCDLPGKRPNQVNGTFTDSTTPTPLTDGNHVWFVNAGGFMACHTMDGKRVWEKEFEGRTKHSAKQFQPFLKNGNLYYVMMRDKTDKKRRPQTATDYDKNSKTGWPWMFVRTFDALTGKPTGIMPDGISVHSKGALGMLNGETVFLHAKGGSHKPPETPFGISLSRLNSSHVLIWEREGLHFEGTHFFDEKYAYCFNKNNFNVLDLATGETVKQIQLRDTGSIVTFDETNGRYNKPVEISTLKSRRWLTHRSNIGVGKFHFFMGGRPGILGRIDVETEEVCYLQVPIQVVIENGNKKLSWSEFKSGDDTGSGFAIEGDKRRLGHGFGHISAATPIVVNNHIYFSTVLGTVYVIDATAKRFDENALVAVNDLGVAGETWTLSPFTASNGQLYQRTSKEIVSIGTVNSVSFNKKNNRF